MNPCHIGNQPIEAVSAITDPLKGSFLNNGSMFLDVCACGAQGEMRMQKSHQRLTDGYLEYYSMFIYMGLVNSETGNNKYLYKILSMLLNE